MNTSPKTNQKSLLTISNLCWIGKKEDGISVESRSQFLKNYFPEAKWEMIEFDASEEKVIPQKMALLYKKWSEQKKLNELGIVCANPVGFESWNHFMNFIRMEPPAFLMKLTPRDSAVAQKVLVPVDFSSGTERMIPMIKRIVEMALDKEIVLLHLFKHQKNSLSQSEELILRKEKIEEMQWYFEANLDPVVREKLILDAIPKTGTDNANILNDYIHAKEVDLVVLGSHNFDHYHYLLYGSTVADILKKEVPAHVCVIF